MFILAYIENFYITTIFDWFRIIELCLFALIDRPILTLAQQKKAPWRELLEKLKNSVHLTA